MAVVLVLTSSVPALSLAEHRGALLALHSALLVVVVIIAYRHDALERRCQKLRAIREERDLHAEALGRVGASIAHDLNNLLTIITHQASALEATTSTDAERDRLSDIRSAGNKAAGLSRRFLDFALGQVKPPRKVPIDRLIRELEPLLASLLGSRVQLELQYAPSLLRVDVDSLDLERVLLNVIVNARDAMPDGGTVTIHVRNVSLDEVYVDSHPGARRGTHVLLEVQDTGVGMDEVTCAKAFEPRFTTKAEEGGTGLGLATVRSIVEQAGGHVTLWSEPGKGTVFRIYLRA